MKTTLLTLLIAIIGGALLGSCSTTRGFGRDLQKLGAKIEQKAVEKSRY